VALTDRVRAAYAFDAARFHRFVAGGKTLGHVRNDLVRHLSACGEVLRVRQGEVSFVPGLDSFNARTQAMRTVALDLARKGLLTRWRSETYDIGHGRDLPPLFALERAAVRFFGFTSFAVHANGLTGVPVPSGMWIARRSLSKPIDPGMLDNLVGGGLASGLSVRSTLVKEAGEEAGIDEEIAAHARAAGILRIRREVPEGLQSEVVFVHDLPLPDDFVPKPTDGEVAEFRHLPIGDVLSEVAGDGDYTVDAALVIVDCLVRHGFVSPDDAHYLELNATR